MLYLLIVSCFAQFLNDPVEKFLRYGGQTAFAMQKLQNSLYVLSNSSSSVYLYKVSEDFLISSEVLRLEGENIYGPVKLFSNSTMVFVVVSVFFVNSKEIPALSTSVLPSLSTQQVLFLIISQSSAGVVWSEFVGDCFGGNNWGLDGFYYSSSILLLLKDTCTPGKLVLQTVGLSKYHISASGDLARFFIMQSFLYVISSAKDLFICKFDLLLAPQWNVTILNTLLVDYKITTNGILILTSSSFYQVTSTGKVTVSNIISGVTFQSLSMINGDFYAFGTNGKIGELYWISSSLFINSQREYMNITRFIDIIPAVGTHFFLLLNSDKDFYISKNTQGNSMLIVSANQPFALSNCGVSCNTCFGTTQDQCFSCKYYEITAENINSCGVCDISCSICFGPNFNQCSQCTTGYIFSGTSCYKDLNCPDGYFQSLLLYSCVSCNTLCQKCFGPSSNDCLQCIDSYFLDQNTCISTCPSGKYPVDQTCKLCDPSCYNCTGPTSSNCSACPPNLYFYNNSCISSCPAQSYALSNFCYSCSSFCSFCSQSGCSLCEKGYFVKGFFCENCIENCVDCMDKQSCKVCEEGFLFDSFTQTCKRPCPVGYFYSEDLDVCVVCAAQCSTCFGPSSSNCTSCTEGYLLFGTTCEHTTECPESFYQLNNTCYQCTSNCLTCKDSKNCTSCISNYSYINNSCIDCTINDCPCSSNCVKCSNGLCLQCTLDKYLRNSLCVDYCEPSEYLINNTCYCSVLCKSCPNELCVDCIDNYFLLNGTCEPCSPNCEKCNSFESCEICQANYSLYNSKCIEKCPENYSSSNQICIKCGQRCSQCNGNLCLQCMDLLDLYGTYELLNGTCTENLDCIQGYHLSENAEKCLANSNYQQIEDLLSVFPLLTSLLSVN